MATRRKASWLTLLIVVALTFGVTTLGSYVIEHTFARWAFGIDGGPPLADEWVGRLTTASGRPRAVYLELELAESSSRRRRTRVGRGALRGRIDGTLKSCDERGTVREYTVDGTPDDRDAARFSIHAQPVEEPPSEGLTFSWIKGRWDGADRLELAPSFFWQKGTGSISGPDYPETQGEPSLPMRRGGEAEFRAACDAIRRR
jgi:hypothetical protein